MSKQAPWLRAIYVEIGAFSVIVFVSWANELWQITRIFFGGEYSSNWHEAMFESLVILIVAIPTILITWRIIKRLHYLEEFVRVCAWCKKVGKDEGWVSIEEYFATHFDTKTSHGICPSCYDKLKQEL